MQTKREMYLDGKLTHHKYYLLAALEAGIDISTTSLRQIAAANYDVNAIKCQGFWDSFMTPKKLADVLRSYGDVHGGSLASKVCAYKAIARYKLLAIMPEAVARKQVNDAIKSGDTVMVPDDFVYMMRDTVPPQTMRAGEYYEIIQVGEIAEHDESGAPLYETYMRMTEAAEDSDVADSRMVPNVWYFVSLKTQAK